MLSHFMYSQTIFVVATGWGLRGLESHFYFSGGDYLITINYSNKAVYAFK